MAYGTLLHASHFPIFVPQLDSARRVSSIRSSIRPRPLRHSSALPRFIPPRRIQAGADFRLPYRANFRNRAANLRHRAIEFYFISLVPAGDLRDCTLFPSFPSTGIDKSDGPLDIRDLHRLSFAPRLCVDFAY